MKYCLNLNTRMWHFFIVTGVSEIKYVYFQHGSNLCVHYTQYITPATSTGKITELCRYRPRDIYNKVPDKSSYYKNSKRRLTLLVYFGLSTIWNDSLLTCGSKMHSCIYLFIPGERTFWEASNFSPATLIKPGTLVLLVRKSGDLLRKAILSLKHSRHRGLNTISS